MIKFRPNLAIMLDQGPQNSKRGLQLCYWALQTTVPNLFSDQSIPSIRKVDNANKNRIAYCNDVFELVSLKL